MMATVLVNAPFTDTSCCYLQPHLLFSTTPSRPTPKADDKDKNPIGCRSQRAKSIAHAYIRKHCKVTAITRQTKFCKIPHNPDKRKKDSNDTDVQNPFQRNSLRNLTMK